MVSHSTFSGAVVEAYGNDFIKTFGNGYYFVHCGGFPASNDPVRISMENNYWQDGPLSGIEEGWRIGLYVWDFNDDPNLGVIVDYDPFSSEPLPTEKEGFGSIKAMFR